MLHYDTTDSCSVKCVYMTWRRGRTLRFRLRELREFLGETQEVFAERVGVTSQSISDYENGRSQPSKSRVARLARQLRIPVDLFGEDAPYPHSALQRLAGPQIVAEGNVGAKASDYATAALANGNNHVSPTADEVRALVSQRLDECRRTGTVPPLWEVFTWLDLAEKARRASPGKQ